MAKRPGGELATRPLHFIWIADCSGSMSIDGKIQALNNAIREALPHMRTVADENPNAEVLVRALKFSTGAQWHVSQPTPVADFKWVDLQTEGVTDLGRALTMLAEQLRIPPMTDRALPPVLVLISDGCPTDDFTKGLASPDGRAVGQKGGAHRHRHWRRRRYHGLAEVHRPPGVETVAGQQPRSAGALHQMGVDRRAEIRLLPGQSSGGRDPGGLNVPIPAPPVALAKPGSAGDVW